MFLEDGDVLLHIVGGAQHHWDPLVDGVGLDVQHVRGPGRGHPSRLLHDVGHGVALVQQSQLPSERDQSYLSVTELFMLLQALRKTCTVCLNTRRRVSGYTYQSVTRYVKKCLLKGYC